MLYPSHCWNDAVTYQSLSNPKVTRPQHYLHNLPYNGRNPQLTFSTRDSDATVSETAYKVGQEKVELHPFPLFSNIYGNLSNPKVPRPKQNPENLGILFFRPLNLKKLYTSCLQQKLQFWAFHGIFVSKSFLKRMNQRIIIMSGQ